MKRRGLIVSALSLSIAMSVASTAISLAWYGSGSRLLIDQITISIRNDQELYIGTRADEKFEKQNLDGELHQVERYSPVSGMYSSLWKDNKGSLPILRSSYPTPNILREKTYKHSYEAKVYPDIDPEFFQQEIYLYSNTNAIVTIDKDSVAFLADNVKNKEYLEKQEKYQQATNEEKVEMLAQLNNITHSLRFSLLNPDEEEYSYYIVDPFKSEDTYYCGALDNVNDHYYDYYNDDGNFTEFVYGEYQNEDKIVYDDSALEDILTSKKYTCFDADVKKGVRHFNWEKSIENGFVPAKEDSLSLLEIEDVVEIPVFAYQPKKIVVSLYLEGWDRDNTELSVFGSFNASLSFKIKRSMQQR